MHDYVTLWLRDRQLQATERTCRAVAPTERLPLVQSVVQRADTVDEVYLALWIIDRLPYPDFVPYQEAASIIAYKMHMTTHSSDDRKMSLYIKRHKLVCTRKQLKACEVHVLQTMQWALPSVCIVSHVKIILRAINGSRHAEKEIGNAVMRVLLHYEAVGLPEMAVAAAAFCTGICTADDIVRLIKPVVSVSCTTVDALLACMWS